MLVDYLRLTDLKDVPALLRWVDVCERNGLMSSITAAQWRLRIEEWRKHLELEKASK